MVNCVSAHAAPTMRLAESFVLRNGKKIYLPCQQGNRAGPNRKTSCGWPGAMQDCVGHARFPELCTTVKSALLNLRGRSDAVTLRRVQHQHVDVAS